MTDTPTIFRQPLVEVGGMVGSSHSITLWMHEGFDRPLHIATETLFNFAADKPGGAQFLVVGDLSNPYFSWPVYMRVRRR